MKLISQILFISFFMIVACPAIQVAAISMQSTCDMQSCESSDTETEEESCPFAMCNSCSCCFCCLIFPVENKKIEINVYQTNIDHSTASGQYLLAGYTNTCWQPPELV